MRQRQAIEESSLTELANERRRLISVIGIGLNGLVPWFENLEQQQQLQVAGLIYQDERNVCVLRKCPFKRAGGRYDLTFRSSDLIASF